MHAYIALWKDDTATLHIMPSKDGTELVDDIDNFGWHESATIYEICLTPYSPSEFALKRVRINDDWKIVPCRVSRKKTK